MGRPGGVGAGTEEPRQGVAPGLATPRRRCDPAVGAFRGLPCGCDACDHSTGQVRWSALDGLAPTHPFYQLGERGMEAGGLAKDPALPCKGRGGQV